MKLDSEMAGPGVDGIEPLGEDLVDRGVLATPAAEEDLDRPSVDAGRAPCEELEARMSGREESESVLRDGHSHHVRVPLVDVMPRTQAHELEPVRDAVAVKPWAIRDKSKPGEPIHGVETTMITSRRLAILLPAVTLMMVLLGC